MEGKEGMSDVWMSARGLGEGCSTSPILFNTCHRALKTQAEEAKGEQGAGDRVCWMLLPGGSFAGGWM